LTVQKLATYYLIVDFSEMSNTST